MLRNAYSRNGSEQRDMNGEVEEVNYSQKLPNFHSFIYFFISILFILQNIRVLVRIRPMQAKEKVDNEFSIVESVEGNKEVQVKVAANDAHRYRYEDS